ncbi:protein of unknown function [Nocardia cyriacigeorgica GUH-2]|uniref:Uncharacterized protein n=1 Tax=Nocardia cyriacigeorgica (strain GUH-2) TaxID=1127134 RepID=H6R9D7_NOCCG|nr:protein of unknown function [Nocardia cyriacigeorgica GUH-2]
MGDLTTTLKPQVEVMKRSPETLESLIRKLPDTTALAPPPVERPKPQRARQLDAEEVA